MEKNKYKDQIIFASEILGITIGESAIRFHNFQDDEWANFTFWYTTGLTVD